MADSIRPSTQITTQITTTRLADIRNGAAVLMVTFLAVGIILATVKGDNARLLSVGMHLVNAGITMIVAVGAAALHKAGMELGEQARVELAEMRAELAGTNRRLDRIIAALADEVGGQRAGHN